ncbi:MAG TPA: thiamine pyrophosphate-binding protein [Polyangiaceae bacterium]
MLAAEFLADALVELGIRHVFGVGGANIEDVFVAIQRRRPKIRVVLAKHEHGAGTAADAYARISGRLGVVLATSGGGALNLTHALAEARASRVPLLAVVGDPPTPLQGRGAFQDTSGRGLVDSCAVYERTAKFCARVEDAGELPRLLAEAVRSATSSPAGPAVLLLAKDRQRAEVAPALHGELPVPAPPGPCADDVERAAKRLDDAPVVVIAGDEVARTHARAELVALVRRLDALVAVTPDGRDAFENLDRRFLGVAGSMGHASVSRAVAAASTVLLAGTRLPLLARQGLEPLIAERNLISVACEPPFVESPSTLHLPGNLPLCLSALAHALRPRPETHAPPAPPETSSDAFGGAPELDLRSALRAVDRAIPAGSVVLVDAGNTGAAAAHVVRAPSEGRWLLALGMAGMGYSFGGAIGAALASGQRCFVLAGDGAFFMHGMEVHTALQHALPITFVVFDNRAHGMCLVRERLLLKTDAGYNSFGRSSLGAGLSAMFPGLLATDCSTRGELEEALGRAVRHEGPSFLGVSLRSVEVPPFAAFQEAGGRPFSALPMGEPA